MSTNPGPQTEGAPACAPTDRPPATARTARTTSGLAALTIPAPGSPEDAAAKLSRIRAVLAVPASGTGDRQYALEEIERIAGDA
jgi:hypothetical protein